jgi:HEAT repeat protein
MSEFDFQPYLRAIVAHYSNQRHLYTLTDVLLPLEARSVEREEDDREKRVEQFPVLAGLRRYAIGDEREHVLLAGRPGSGKSTALRQLVVELAEARQPLILGGHEGGGSQIPVLVQLKGSAPVLEAIGNELERGDLELEPKEIKRLLRHQRLILLFDGVNEIPTESLRQQLQEFRDAYPETPMIFTTRDLAIGGSLGISKQLEMKPLSPEQLQEFVGKYLPEQGEKLLGQLRDRLREIAETPLLLKMLCDVFGQTGEIPANKGELFRLFDREYEKFKGLPAVSADFRRFKSEILQRLAFVMMQGDESKPTEFWLTIERSRAERSIEQWLAGRVSDPGVRAKEWLEDLLEHHLLQVAADGRRVEFHHQLFQEYYAAEALLGMFADRHLDVVEPERFQHFYLNYLKWTESVAIVLSLMEDEETAVDLVKQALDADLMLGARLAGAAKTEFQGRTVRLVEEIETLSWLKVEMLGKTQSNEAISALSHFIEHEDDELLIRVVKAFDKIRSEAAIPGLLKLVDVEKWDVAWDAVSALGEISSEKAISELVQLVDHYDFCVRGSLAETLGSIRTEAAIDALIELSEDCIPDVGLSAIRSLIEIDHEAAVPGLLSLIENEYYFDDPFVRSSAAEMLGEIGAKEAIPGLLKLVEYDDFYVRSSAAKALGKLGVPGLTDFVEDDDSNHSFIYGRTTDALIAINSEVAIPELLELIEDNDFSVRSSAAKTLGELGTKEVIPALLKLLERSSISVCKNVAEALGTIAKKSQTAMPPHLPALFALVPTQAGEDAHQVILAIQANCKFYNYEIFHSPPAKPQPTQQGTLDTIATTVVETNERIKQMAEQPSIQIGSISGGINNFTPNQGTQNLTQIETQNNYSTDPNLLQTIQNLLQQNTDLHNFITDLETQSPQTEAEAETARDRAITDLQTTNPILWKTIRTQMRTLKHQILNPERHAQAAKATLVEVTKAYWEKSLIAKAIITYIDKLSETPDQGA